MLELKFLFWVDNYMLLCEVGHKKPPSDKSIFKVFHMQVYEGNLTQFELIHFSAEVSFSLYAWFESMKRGSLSTSEASEDAN